MRIGRHYVKSSPRSVVPRKFRGRGLFWNFPKGSVTVAVLPKLAEDFTSKPARSASEGLAIILSLRFRAKGVTTEMTENESPWVGIIMGSKSDWETMRQAADVLTEFDVPHECRVVSAHRTPEWMVEYAQTAEERGLEVIIAGAGGAAHLPGMVASLTLLPVLGVPVKSRALSGLDSLLSIVQMPGGVPVGTLAIGESGAKNAGLLAVRILANHHSELRDKLRSFHQQQTDQVMGDSEL